MPRPPKIVHERVVSPVEPPALPDGLRPETLRWWQSWLDSPIREFMVPSDWQALLRLAVLVEEFWTTHDANLAGKINALENALGGGVKTRKIIDVVVKSDADDEPASAPVRQIRRPDPRVKGA